MSRLPKKENSEKQIIISPYRRKFNSHSIPNSPHASLQSTPSRILNRSTLRGSRRIETPQKKLTEEQLDVLNKGIMKSLIQKNKQINHYKTQLLKLSHENQTQNNLPPAPLSLSFSLPHPSQLPETPQTLQTTISPQHSPLHSSPNTHTTRKLLQSPISKKLSPSSPQIPHSQYTKLQSELSSCKKTIQDYQHEFLNIQHKFKSYKEELSQNKRNTLLFKDREKRIKNNLQTICALQEEVKEKNAEIEKLKIGKKQANVKVQEEKLVVLKLSQQLEQQIDCINDIDEGKIGLFFTKFVLDTAGQSQSDGNKNVGKNGEDQKSGRKQTEECELNPGIEHVQNTIQRISKSCKDDLKEKIAQDLKRSQRVSHSKRIVLQQINYNFNVMQIFFLLLGSCVLSLLFMSMYIYFYL